MITFYTNQSIIIPYNNEDVDYVDYHLYEAEEISDGEVERGEEIYYGRAYSLDDSNIHIDLSDIVLPLVTPVSVDSQEGGKKEFLLIIDDDQYGARYPFRVWYYNLFNKEGETDIYTSKVIKGVVGESAPLIMTHTFDWWYDDDTETITVTGYNDGVEMFSESTSFNSPTLIYNYNVVSGCDRIEYTYTQGLPLSFGVVPDCDRPTLYWQNQLGGISQVLLNPTNHAEYSVEKHHITRRVTKWDRRDTSPFWTDKHGKVSYLNEGTLKWVLNTPLLSDSDMEEMTDLILSNKAWLWIDGKMYAVNVKDTNVKVKKFKEDKMFNLTINCEYAQTITTY